MKRFYVFLFLVLAFLLVLSLSKHFLITTLANGQVLGSLTETPPIAQILPLESSSSPILTPDEVFALYPVLRRISACESTGSPNGLPRQFLANGSPLWGNDPTTGKPIKRDVGIFQLNTWVWAAKAKTMGLDIVNSADDNATFAEWLYEQQGTSPWNPSKGCWAQ